MMIRLEHIEKTYDRRKSHANHVVADMNLTLPDTGFVCILGPSGCGKTTLMNVMGGLDAFDRGRITVGETSVTRYGTTEMENERNRQFGYVFQNYYLMPERTVTYNVYLGLHSLPLSRKEKLRRVKNALEAVEMDRFARRKVSELSGGQQQRVAIARALARQPKVIFADEPTGNLDETNTNRICRILRQIAGSCLVVMVTHEERIAREYADRVIRLDQGKIVSDCENEPLVAEHGIAEEGSHRESDRDDVGGAEKADHGLGLRVMLEESFGLWKNVKQKTALLLACLAVLTAVVVLAVGDYMTTANINPEDFIVTDSHLLEVNVMRGGTGGESVSEGFEKYLEYLKKSGLDMTFVPMVASRTYYSYDSFVQMNTLSEGVQGFSYIPIEKLDETDLIYGRMPQDPEEVVADRWTLEKFLSGSGVLQAGIADLTQFLGTRLSVTREDIRLEIVGICDSGEPAVYVDPYALLTIGSSGTAVMSLTQFQQRYPGEYDDVVLEEGMVLAGPKAGVQKPYNYFSTSSKIRYQIQQVVDKDIYAQLVVADDQKDALLMAMMKSTRHFYIYSEQKDGAKKLLQGKLPEELQGVIQVEVTDHYSDYMASYRAATAKRVNARTIVTVTILIAAAVMLMFILRARVNERMDMLAVYRLLGIPERKTLAIFALESLELSLISSLPAAILTWGVVKALTVMPSMSFSMILPFGVGMLAYLVTLCFHLAVSLLPVDRLLRLPPAVLASRDDF